MISMKERLTKRGLSPVIATVLLITMVIVIGLIIFLWFRSLTQEAVTKFGGTNIELVCNDVSFSADYTGGSLTLQNFGNVPIYSMKLEVSSGGNQDTLDIRDLNVGWSESGLTAGGVFSGSLSSKFSGYNEVLVVPVLLGTSESGEQTHVCDDRFAQQIIL